MKKNSLTPKKCVKVEKVSELWGITVFCNAAANIKVGGNQFLAHMLSVGISS
jgi:phage antirepressor YoqD-like protein